MALQHPEVRPEVAAARQGRAAFDFWRRGLLDARFCAPVFAAEHTHLDATAGPVDRRALDGEVADCAAGGGAAVLWLVERAGGLRVTRHSIVALRLREPGVGPCTADDGGCVSWRVEAGWSHFGWAHPTGRAAALSVLGTALGAALRAVPPTG